MNEITWELTDITGLELMNGKLYRKNSQNNENDGFCKDIQPLQEAGQMAYQTWFRVLNDFSDDVIVPGHAVSRVFYE